MDWEIFRKMFIEEWRIHTSAFDSKLFAFFPVLIAIGAFVLSLFLPFLMKVMTIKQLFLSVHFIFIFLGVSIGAFGLFGREIMNRRFGQASLIAYSSRSLPVSERRIFFHFFLKDVIYYIFLWILPIILGFLIATFFIDINIFSAILASSSLMFSFLIGLSIVFFLSTIYAHSSKILVILLTAAGIILLFLNQAYEITFTKIIIPYWLYYEPTINKTIFILGAILIPTTLSLIFLKVDYPHKKKQHKNKLTDFTKKLSFSKYSFYVAKDFIDLNRSEGGVGKIIFSFLLPVAFTWMFIGIFLELIPTIKTVMIFSIFLGIVSSSIYNIVTAFDTFNPYMFLPVKVSIIIKSKIISYLLINIVSLIILTIVSISMNQILYFIPALFIFITISFVSLSATIYFTGLSPTILMYNSKIFFEYSLSLAPMLFAFTFLTILNPFYLLLSPVLLIPGFWVLKRGLKKWDNWTPESI